METQDVISRIKQEISRPPNYTTVRVNTEVKSAREVANTLRDCIHQQYEDREEPPPTVDVHESLADVLVVAGKGRIERPLCEKAVIVDHCCGCAVLRGAHVFTSGILAAPSNMQTGDMVSVFADLDGRCLMGLTQVYAGRTLHVGNGVAMYSRSDIFVSKEKPRGIGIRMTAPLYDCPSLSGLLPELIFPQNLPSAVVGHIVDPQPGENILDMCAAPGGKTTHLATLMKNKGRIVAMDRSSKIKKIKENCKTWGINIVEAYAFDATKCIEPGADISEGPPYPPESFERVLLDGPCSALGQRPMLVNNMSDKQLASHSVVQKSLFKQAVLALKRGGCLVYSTCTLPIEENECVVAWALKTFPELELVRQVPHLGGQGIDIAGLTKGHAMMLQRFGPAKFVNKKVESKQYLRIFSTSEDNCGAPMEDNKSAINRLDSNDCNNTATCNDDFLRATGVDNDTIGFFIAKFVKR